MNLGDQDAQNTGYFEGNIVYWKTLNDPFTGNWKDQPFVFHDSPNIPVQPTLTATFTSDYNLFFNPLKPAESIRYNGFTIDEWHQKGKDIHSVYTDPMFVNPEQFDFNLKPGSPALKMGFRNIDMKEVGPRK